MNRQFPALRGLAILLVVLHHSIMMGTLYPLGLGYPRVEGLGRWVLLVLQGLGVFAVPTFLFISGSFVAYAARGDPARFTWKAVWATLNRILWPYLFWSLVYYAVVYVLRGERPALSEAEGSSLLGIFKNLVIGYPYHFIPLLVFYYLISPILIGLAKRWGLVSLIIIALIQLALLNLESPGILGFVFPGWIRTIVPRYYNGVFADWGIYFPLGVVCGLSAKVVALWARRVRWLLLATTLVFFVLYILSAASVLRFPLAGHICPPAFVFLSLVIERNSIPRARTFEHFGKTSYGVYLIHLSALWATAVAIQAIAPWLFEYQILLHPTLFLSALGIPLVIMRAVTCLPIRRAYRYVFG